MLKKCWDSCAAGCAADLRGEKRGALQVGRGTLLASREACFDIVADVCSPCWLGCCRRLSSSSVSKVLLDKV